MTANTPAADELDAETRAKAEELLRQESGDVILLPPWAKVFAAIAFLWSLFQLWIASPFPFWFNFGIIGGVPARGIHLAFAFALVFLAYGFMKKGGGRTPSWFDVLLAIVAVFCASYLWWGYDGLSERAGRMLTHDIAGMTVPSEAILGVVGIVLLLEATRRAIGLPLVILSVIFLLYSIFGQYMPDLISHKGVSFERLASYQWLTGEAVFGIPIDVSARFIFLFVLFGAILDRAGAGQYFIDLAFALVGKYRGGPAKAAVLSSGLAGMISGSSVANVVTTGTFTIPVMKKSGLSGEKAGAIEVAASVNGQIMPPIMGAAAFVMAELIGITYFDVVTHAFIPAVISYIALFYITDLEAQKLGMRGMDMTGTPRASEIFWRGAHYIVPIIFLVYLLMVEQITADAAVFWSVIMLAAIVVGQEVVYAYRQRASLAEGLKRGSLMVVSGLIMGGKNMMGIAVAVAAAGIIVGAVAATGLSNSLSSVVEAIAGNNVYILLGLVAVLSIILGMGLPTTANYLVVAAIMAPVIVEVGAGTGLILPLVAVHLFVFYFGLMADVTPPVGLAAFAAAAISRADPIKTGVVAFYYSIRTAILPFIFIFNLDLLLIDLQPGWAGVVHAVIVFFASLAAIMAFTALSFRWMFTRLNLAEMALLALVSFAMFRPGFFMDRIYPPYEPLTVAQFTKGVPGEYIRIHISRDTPIGEKQRVFAFPDSQGGQFSASGLGMTISAGPDGTGVVTDPGFMSVAEQTGILAGDRIRLIEKRILGQPDKEWIYIPGLALLLLVGMMNRGRARSLKPAAA